MRALPTVHVASGGTSNSLFGDDLYVYSLSKHNRPPLKPYWGLEALLVESQRTKGKASFWGGQVLAISMVPISGALGLLFTPRVAYRKGNHSHLKPSGVSLEFSWGSLFLCEKSPSRSTRNSPNSVWGSRFSGAVPCHSLSVDWRGSDIPALLGTNLHFRWGTVWFMEELEAWEPGPDCVVLLGLRAWTNTMETKLTGM